MVSIPLAHLIDFLFNYFNHGFNNAIVVPLGIDATLFFHIKSRLIY